MSLNKMIVDIDGISFESAYTNYGDEIERFFILAGDSAQDFSEFLEDPDFYETIYQHNQDRIETEKAEVMH